MENKTEQGAAPAQLTGRNTTIDLLRALCMALMLMVNDFWSVSGVPHWMQHAAATEDMLGFSDIIFPSFLFCVGLSIPYAIRAMRAKGRTDAEVIRHILWRSFALLAMGAFICNYESGIDRALSGYDSGAYCVLMTLAFFLVYATAPKFFGRLRSTATGQHRIPFASIVGAIILVWLLLTSRHSDGGMFHPSWWGILGLIGWAYLFCALVYALSAKKRTLWAVWALLLAVCFGCTRTAPWAGLDGAELFHGPVGNAVGILTSILHLGNASCALLVMSGVVFTEAFVSRGWKTWGLLAIGLLVAGFLSHQLFIVSKIIGTLPWIFFVLAIDVLAYALLNLLVENNRHGWLAPLRPAGTATLTCYMIPYVLYPLTSSTLGWDWSYAIPHPFGLLKCALFSALCILIAALLGRVGIRLKL